MFLVKEPGIFCVALLAEGVDRNLADDLVDLSVCKSPSSRRAWIEIVRLDFKTDMILVALLAEGVDRNARRLRNMAAVGTSPSSRRAWIEMSSYDLRTFSLSGRPPRGGRG